MLDNWLDALVEIGSSVASSTALNLAAMSMHGGRRLSTRQIEKIITQPAFFAHNKPGERMDVMLTHYWSESRQEARRTRAGGRGHRP